MSLYVFDNTNFSLEYFSESVRNLSKFYEENDFTGGELKLAAKETNLEPKYNFEARSGDGYKWHAKIDFGKARNKGISIHVPWRKDDNNLEREIKVTSSMVFHRHTMEFYVNHFQRSLSKILDNRKKVAS